jgi:hypothetical protein
MFAILTLLTAAIALACALIKNEREIQAWKTRRRPV